MYNESFIESIRLIPPLCHIVEYPCLFHCKVDFLSASAVYWNVS